MWLIIWITLLTLAISILSNNVLKNLLIRYNVLDYPTNRSSHSQPKPRGGGIAVVLSISIGTFALYLAGVQLPQNILVTGMVSLFIAIISWVDDYKNLSPLLRFGCQIFCVGIALAYLDFSTVTMSNFVPPWIFTVFLGLGWLWFINLYNFMDGIDGITGIETTCITCGILLLCIKGEIPFLLAGPALVVIAAMIGFLIFNWPPSQIFLGDVGSITLGFLIGWMLIELFILGQWAAAIILPGYYLLDATITLVIRMHRGKKIWQPHREHFYQKAVHGQLSHSGVIYRLLTLNLILIAISSTFSSEYPSLSVFFSIFIILVFLLHLKSYFRKSA